MGILAIALGVAAWAHPGLDQADVHLDEGTVYAVNRNAAMAGMVNTQIESLAAATTVADRQTSILQHRDLVILRGEDSNTLTRYNPSRNRLESPMVLPSSADVQLVGSRLMVTSPNNGRVWFGPAEDVLAMDPDKDKAQFEVGINGVATLTAQGEIIGLDVHSSQLVRQEGGKRVATDLPFTLDANRVGTVELSAVGDKAVVLDRASGRIWVEGSKHVLDVSGAASAQLLPPVDEIMGSKEDVQAVVATEAGLVGVTSDGMRSLSGHLAGAPVQPVQVGECLYGVSGVQFVKRCGDGEPQVQDIPGYDGRANATLSLQVNRRTVALNEAQSGVIWLVDQHMARIDNWEEFITEDSEEPPPPDAPTTDEKADRDEENQPPFAQDDELTARAGRATLLDVLDNDSDPDGDVLTIQTPDDIDGASLQTVRGGTGLQITIPPESTKQSFTFSYTISDGFLTDSATVTVNVADRDPTKENKAPYPFELAQPITIHKGEALTKRILTDWRDPEGDPLILENAFMPPGSEDLVTFNPDGTINYQDIGKTTGRKKINVTISDGTDTTDGELVINVVEDPVKPVAYADFATVQVGQSVEVKPLENDLGENLILQEVVAEDCTTCTLVPDYADQSFTFSAPKQGTYYLTYNVASGEFDTGVVRIDVVPPGSDNPPVAALDIALLPPEGSVLVDPLANDTDADGDVLVIQSFSADPTLEVKLERRHLMTISAKSTPAAPVTVEYVVSDGKHVARGSIVVIPTKTTGSVHPVAADDDLNVRAGSIATAPVLTNDTSPIGLELRLHRILESPLGDGAWIDGDNIRVRIPAGSQRQQIAIAYEVIDEEGNTASAVLNVTAVSEDSPNQPPAPKEVVDRVLSGTSTRIPIHLGGIDPNGDAVTLLGLGAGPQLGRVTEVGEEYLTYEAFPTSEGTDTFRYEVADAHGEVASGQIRIGIAPPGDVNQPPVAVHDEITVRPGRPIQIPALANDYDFEGDSVGFAASNAVAMEDTALNAEVVNDREIAIDPISKPGRYQGTYRITDSRQQENIGSFTVIVDEDAPLAAPVARDDTLSFMEVVDQQIVDVDVTANDFDPDGQQDDLRVTVPDEQEDAQDSPRATEGKKVSVPVTQHMQQVRYALTDGDGNTAYGLATIPGTEDARPVVREPNRALQAIAGQPVQISFDDLLAGTRNRKVKLTSTDTIVAAHGSAVPATGGVEYTPDANYSGPAAVVFEVIDVVPEGDESAKRSYVTIPVEVKANENADGGDTNNPTTQLPPEQVSRGLLQVAPGEGEFRLSAMPLFRDPNGLDFTFSDWAEAGGDAPITWHTESNQSVVVASAPLTAKAGATKTLRGKVTNAQGASSDFEVVLEMVSSRQPLTTTATDVVEDAAAGQPVTVPVTANDTSHLTADPTLTVTGASIVSGSGAIKFDDSSVTITPAKGFVGTLSARYSVQDATKDPSRVVDGSIRLDVKDRPSAPSAPFGGVAGDGQIRFEYRSGSPNGYPIDKREVIATAPGHGSVKQECQGNTCTITGLKNNVPWTLSVVEYNKLGASDPSPQSAAYTPDVKPLPPAQPTVERGDQALTVSWEAARFANPDNAGSPVQAYTVILYDSNGKKLGTQKLGGNARSHTWTGLQNGKTYSFGVIAANEAGASEESQRSTPIFPVGPPKGSAIIRASAVNDAQGGSFTVSLSPGTLNPNGDPDMEVLVVPIVDGHEDVARAQSLKFPFGPAKDLTFSGYGTSAVRFVVYAKNLANLVKVAQTNNEIIAWGKPELEMTKAFGTPLYPNRVLFVLHTPNLTDVELQRAGAKFQYRIVGSGGGWKDLSRVRGWYATGELNAGQYYQIEVRVALTNTGAQDLVSTAGPVRVLPVTERPKPVELGEMKAVSPDQVAVDIPTGLGLEDTGGWDPNGYVYGRKAPTIQVNNHNIVMGEGHHEFFIGWSGNRPGDGEHWHHYELQAESYDVKNVSSFAVKGNTLTVSVRYTGINDYCNIHAKDGKLLEKVSSRNGAIASSKSYPTSSDPANTQYHKKFKVSCLINGSTKGWQWHN